MSARSPASIARSTQSAVSLAIRGVSRMTTMCLTVSGSGAPGVAHAVDLRLEHRPPGRHVDRAAGDSDDEDRVDLRVRAEVAGQLGDPVLALRERRLGELLRRLRERAARARDRDAVPAVARRRPGSAACASARRGCRRRARSSATPSRRARRSRTGSARPRGGSARRARSPRPSPRPAAASTCVRSAGFAHGFCGSRAAAPKHARPVVDDLRGLALGLVDLRLHVRRAAEQHAGHERHRRRTAGERQARLRRQPGAAAHRILDEDLRDPAQRDRRRR